MSIDHLMQFFKYDHLPEPMQTVSAKFFDLALHLKHNLQPNPETMTALRKLLEAKDCAVRSVIFESQKQ